MDINKTIAAELEIKVQQVEAVVALFEEKATVPFISRYRKEVTGGLTDTQLRALEERLGYLRELEERRTTVIESIEKQDKMTPELKKLILAADNKARLEDLYLPYKQKRRTKAQIAKEAGLEPLLDKLLADPTQEPEALAAEFLNPDKEIKEASAALEGARHIMMERFAEDADLVAELRQYVLEKGALTSQVVKDKEKEGAKFSDYFDYQEPIAKVPSHRALAVLRGQREGFLRVSIGFSEESDEQACIDKIAYRFAVLNQGRAADKWIWQGVEWTWKIKLKSKIEMDLISQTREASEEDAINVFKDNLKNLLMAAPAGPKVTLGLDPGLRTGVKAVVVNDTGKLLEYITIFPHVPKNQWDQSIDVLAALVKKHNVDLISIGNGTASRETDRLVSDLAKRYPDAKFTQIVVSEAGASVYSASELAAKEFPDLDVSYRGAVSIARRLQDPLAELVKIEPKSIGVGQYQHDVNQVKLGRSLNAVLEDCVNSVGADVNSASVPLLKSIAGLNETVAKNIIDFREAHGRFKNREEIKKVPRLGDKTYEQAIGFLRIIGGDNPLDASAVHPEAYPVVENIIQKSGASISAIMGDNTVIKGLKANDFVTDQFGLPTIKDIFSELQKPGRDPRPEFKVAKFKDGVETLADLKPDMILEGVVTNVTNFGAFVDIGVHQDGLVHISQLANQFVSDPHEVVKVGQIVTTKVLEVDLSRKRIQLTMRLDEKAQPASKDRSSNQRQDNNYKKFSKSKDKPQSMGTFGDLLSTAMKDR